MSEQVQLGPMPAELEWYYGTPEWKAKRERALLILGAKCNRCGATPDDGATLQVHHKTYARLFDERIKSDLEVLCDDCHQQHHVALRKRALVRERLREDYRDD